MDALKEKPVILQDTARKKRKIITPLNIICAVIFLAALTVYFWNDIMYIIPTQNVKVKTYNLSGSLSRQIHILGDTAVICGEDGIFAVDKNGREKWKVLNTFVNPVVDISESGMVAASKNGKEIYTVDGNGKSMQYVTENPIVNVKEAGGYITAITNKKSYNGSLTVYDKKGIPLFSWSAGQSNLIDADLSDNGKILAVSVIAFDGNVLNSKIMFFNIEKSDKAYAEYSFGENMVSRLQWNGNNKLLCVGDREFTVCDSKAKKIWGFSYEGKSLNFFDISQENNLVFVLGTSALDRNMQVYSYNKRGGINGAFSHEFDITGIAASKYGILFSSTRQLMLTDKKGNIKNERRSTQDINKIKLFKNGKTAFIDEGAFAEIMYIK